MAVHSLAVSLQKYRLKALLGLIPILAGNLYIGAPAAASFQAHRATPCVLNHVVSKKEVGTRDTETTLAQIGVSWPFKHDSKLYWILPAHLITDADSVTIVTCGRQEVPAEVLFFSKRFDLAIVRPESPMVPITIESYPTVFELNGFMKTKFSFEKFPMIGLYFPRSYDNWRRLEFQTKTVDLLGFETGLPGIQRLLVLNEVASPPSTSGSLAVFPETLYSSDVTTKSDPEWGMLVQTELFSNRSVAVPLESMIRFASNALSRLSLAPTHGAPSQDFASNYEKSSNTQLILADLDHLSVEISDPCSPSNRHTSEWKEVGGGSWGNGGGPGSLDSSMELPNIINQLHDHYFANTFYQPETSHQYYLERPSCFDQGLVIKRIERDSGKTEISRMLLKPRGSGWHRPTLASFLKKDIEQIVYQKLGRRLGDYSPSNNLMDYIKNENDPALHELTYDLMCSKFKDKQFDLQLERKSPLQTTIAQLSNKLSLHELVYQEIENKDLEGSKTVSKVFCSKEKKRFIVEVPGPEELTFRLSLQFGTRAELEILDETFNLLTKVTLNSFAAWSQGGRFTAQEGHTIDFFFELFPPYTEQRSPLLHLNFLELELNGQTLGPLKISIMQ